MALKGTKALLVWSQRCTESYKEVKVDNMTKSWRDGLAFCAIIHHFRPDLIDFYSLSKENVYENNSLAFDVAERELGIPALLDPEDMAAMVIPDKLSIMTYVSQYYNHFKDKKPAAKDGKEEKSKGSKLNSIRRSMRKSKDRDKDKDKDKADGASPRKKPSMGDKCKMCGKHVYMIERQVVDGELFHRKCFKCDRCHTTLRPGSYKSGKDPKKFECLHHGNEVFNLRAKMANRGSISAGSRLASAGSRLAGADDDDNAIWHVQRSQSVTRPKSQPPQPPLHPGATSPTARTKSTSPTRPVSKPPPVPSAEAPSSTRPASSAIALHPHLLASASARSQFASGGIDEPVLRGEHEQKARPVSKETCIDDVIEGSTIPPSQPSRESPIDSPVRQRLPSKETSVDDPSSIDLNQTQDTTGDSMSMKSATSDSVSTTSKEAITTSQDSLLKTTDSLKKDDNVIASPSKKDQTVIGSPAKDENMNAEKSDEEKEVITTSTKEKNVSSIDKVGGDKEEKMENKLAEEKKELENVKEKKDEKWESEQVKENKDSNIVEKKEAGSLDNKETEIKEGSPALIVDAKTQVVDDDDDDSLNPFGDDDDDDDDNVEGHQITNEVTSDVTLDTTLEEKKNKKNEQDVSSVNDDDIVNPFTGSLLKPSKSRKSKDKNNDATSETGSNVSEDSKGAGHMEVARLAVQSQALGDDAKSASSIDDIYNDNLNPFADEEEEGEAQDNSKKEYNPFDESGSEEEEDEYDDSLNPFGDDDEEEEEDEATSNGAAMNPFTGSLLKPSKSGEKPSRPPPPRATQDQSSRYQVKTPQQILQEMHVSRDTIKQGKKKRPAPRRPPPPDGKGTPLPAKDGAMVAPPRRRKTKNRRAPPPPPTQDGTPCPKKTPPDRPPPITVSPSPDDGSQGKPTPSPRLSLLADTGSNMSSPDRSPPTHPKLHVVITPDIQVSSDGEDRPIPSPRKSRSATTCGALKPKKSHSPSRMSMSQKRKAPLPPAIKRDVTKDHDDPTQIQNQLGDNEKQQRELEQRGIELENKLRQAMEAPEADEQENEDVLVEWFKLVNDRNKLIRKEGEYIAQIQMQELEVQHADIEYELRVIMNKQEHKRTDADSKREEELLEMLVDVVTRRSSVVDRLEADRIREEEEDENIRQMMAESGLAKETNEKQGKKKKGSKKKKEKSTWGSHRFQVLLKEHKSEVEKFSNVVQTRAAKKESLTKDNKSAVTDHVVEHNHVIGWEEAKVIGTEQNKYKRWIKEAIEIRKRGEATMNRDEGQYSLSHVFDELLTTKKSPRKSPKDKPTGNPTGNSGDASGNSGKTTTAGKRVQTSVSSMC